MGVPQLKTGWRVVKFGDVVRQCKESVDRDNNPFERYVEGGHMDSEDIHISRWGVFGDDYVGPAFHRIFRKGQILYGSRRTYLKKVARAEFDGITANTTFVCETKNPKVLIQELLPFLMLSDSFTEHSVRESKGSTNPYINWLDIAKYEFSLPPLEEQRCIAGILWAADESIQKHSHALDAMAKLIHTILWEELRHKSTKAMPCKALYSKPPRNGFSPRINAEGAGKPTLSIGAIRNGKVVVEGNVKYAVISERDLERFRLAIGDVLVVRGNGNKELCGKAGLVQNIPQDCFYPDLLIKLIFDKNKIIPEFAVAQWNDKVTHGNLLLHAKSTNGIWKINGKDLQQHKLLVPPLDVQKKVLEKISNLSNVEKELLDHGEQLRILYSKVLNKAFEGLPHV